MPYAVQPATAVTVGRRAGGVETVSVVSHVEQHLVGVVGEADDGAPSPGVLDDVGERSTRRSHEGAGHRRRHGNRIAVHAHLHLDTVGGALGHPAQRLGKRLGRGLPGIVRVESRGREVTHDPAHLVEPLAGGRGSGGDVLAGSSRVVGPSPALPR